MLLELCARNTIHKDVFFHFNWPSHEKWGLVTEGIKHEIYLRLVGNTSLALAPSSFCVHITACEPEPTSGAAWIRWFVRNSSGDFPQL